MPKFKALSPLGGWVLDQTPTFVQGFWLASAASIIIGILILQYLKQIIYLQQ